MAAAPIGLALTAISTVVGVAGAFSQASAQRQQAEYQAAVARNNQIIAEQNKQYATQAGEAQAQAQGFKNRATLGAITAGQAASGIQLDSPTLTDVREGAEQTLRLDTANINANALLRARQYGIQAGQYGAEAELQSMAGRNATTAGFFNAAGSLLGGASSFADKWSRYQSPTTNTAAAY
jgi:hypothetical protein